MAQFAVIGLGSFGATVALELTKLNHDVIGIDTIKRNVENLLRAIENSLPLSSLYLDLNSDKPVENETEISEQVVETLLQDLLAQVPNDLRTRLLERLAVSEPFVHYPQIIKKYE